MAGGAQILPYVEAILDVLADGEWHHEVEITARAAQHVPTGIAGRSWTRMRASAFRHEDPTLTRDESLDKAHAAYERNAERCANVGTRRVVYGWLTLHAQPRGETRVGSKGGGQREWRADVSKMGRFLRQRFEQKAEARRASTNGVIH
jgi:hypothetical protein